MNIKEKILSNNFLDKVRNGFVVDEQDFKELCGLLEELVTEWKDKKEIDKDLAQDLYILPYVTKNMSESLRRNGGDENLIKNIEDKAFKIDDLVLQCFNA